MIDSREMINTRERYLKIIKEELLGPGSEISIPDAEHEIITSSPHMRYSIGILFPKNEKINADNDDSSRIEEISDKSVDFIDDSEINEEKVTSNKLDLVSPADEENLDEEMSLAAQNMPSSLGMTFFIHGNASVINCDIGFATYRHLQVSDCKLPFYPNNPEEYNVPEQLSLYIYYDKEEKCLKLCSSKITKRIVRDLQKNSLKENDEYNLFDMMYKLCNQISGGFIRVPHKIETSLKFGDSDYLDDNQKLDETTAKLTALRRKISDDLYSVTIMFVNDITEHANGTNCLFQPEIRIHSNKNNFVFKEYSGIHDLSILDDEEKSLNLQYRNKKVYGTGLGTSLNWDIDNNGNGFLFNDFFPQVEVPQIDFSLPVDSGVSENALSMKYLSDLENAEKSIKIDYLKELVYAYEKWITNLKSKICDLDEKYRDIAKKNLFGCEKSCKRMYSGIKSLINDEKKWDSFQLANRAMYMQRIHLNIQKNTSNSDRFPYDDELTDVLENLDYYIADKQLTEKYDEKDKYLWRPFQMAFILMSIDSVSDEKSDDRNSVDLIWFPTGGGKTEAYLGLTAFTVFYRKLAHLDESAGTTVIMRYTLRLLTAQQFNRASTLICACEYIRKDSQKLKSKYKTYPLGNSSITIGLWIGGEHTPNMNSGSEKSAQACLSRLDKASIYNLREEKNSYNKFQVLKCPWCGTKMVKEVVNNTVLGSFGYRLKDNRHFELFCPQEKCFFNEILPIQVVDEELYRNPPTLLFGTVDKFAMLPWKKDIGIFFGLNSKNRSPELIIQDELHLISGPLGTMVGLYETVIDLLCKEKGLSTKIVASTATIRRSSEQCSALYDRNVDQFPHPALDAEDSFFAREGSIDHDIGKYGRFYVGLMPSGKTKAMMEIRVIAALLQKINIMKLSDEVKDKYWTLTVYFNSLKDLGKCSTLVNDDIKDFIKRSAYRLGTSRDARMIAEADELTSRVSTTALNETLDKLEKLTFSKENIEKKRYASNILLATNMISVGLDVARLNVMLMVGQPKLTSEYIQASSRIGRSYPGVTFALYDGSKSRDRSHYEQFKQYHESFYKYVEPTGVTPFSKPARDRALHAVIIALLRHLIPELSEEKDAAAFLRNKYIDKINYLRNFITKRNSSIIQRMNSGMEDDSADIVTEIEYIISTWESLTKSYKDNNFLYGEKYIFKHPDKNQGRLLKAFNSDRNDTSAFDTMTSMRNVDASVVGNVLVWGE